jgi:hypothetical protein
MSQRSGRIDNGIQKSSRWLQDYTHAIQGPKAYTSSTEQWKEVVVMRLSRIHSRGKLDTYTLAQDLNALETTLERHARSGNRQGMTLKTISSKEQFHKVTLKILIQTSEEKDSSIR